MRMVLQHIGKNMKKPFFVSKGVDRPHLTKFYKRLEVQVINLRGACVDADNLARAASSRSQAHARRSSSTLNHAQARFKHDGIPGLSARCSQQ